MKKKSYLIIGIIVVILLIVFGCLGLKKCSTQKNNEQVEIISDGKIILNEMNMEFSGNLIPTDGKASLTQKILVGVMKKIIVSLQNYIY